MLFKAFFWDFDGTLYDTYPRLARALQKSLREHGIDAPLDEVLRRMKRTLREACEEYCLDHPELSLTPDALENGYRVHAEEEGPETMRPYPGAEAMLRAVVDGGGQNFIFTHRGSELLPALQKEGLDGYFTDMVTARSGFRRKPSPEGLEYLIRKHGLRPEDCCMVGDREIDLESARGAGISRVLFDPDGYMDLDVPYRFSSMDAMREALCEKGG